MSNGGIQEPSGSITNIITRAQYHSIEGGEKRDIHLIDAISPLIYSPSHQLLLSSRPISVPWPLALNDESEDDASSIEAKKRKKDDKYGDLIQHLQDLLKVDVPKALEQLLISMKGRNDDWLTLLEDQQYTFSQIEKDVKEERVDWVALQGLEQARHAAEEDGRQTLIVSSTIDTDLRDLMHRLIVNQGASGNTLRGSSQDLAATEIYMPSKSAFLITDLLRSHLEIPRGWQQVLAFADDHPPSLILLDPPYPNYSAKRLKTKQESYQPIEDLYDLWKMKLPVQQLLERRQKDKGVLVGCWVTNNAKIQRFILSKLFLEWNLHHIGQLVWIKVTTSDAKNCVPGGQLVFPINNKQGRKPYEILLLGHTKSPPSSHQPQSNIFASVPLGHSRKPAVYDLLRPLLSPSSNVNVYELFARGLFPGHSSEGYWVSIGKEPVQFSQQGVGYRYKDGK